MISRLAVFFLLTTLTCLLVSCANQAHKPLRYMHSQLKYALSASEECRSEIGAEEVYRRVDKIMILDANDPLAIRKTGLYRYMSQGEKDDLLALRNLLSRCRKRNLENFGKIHPDLVALLAKWYAENDETALAVIEDRINIGEANKVHNKRFSNRNEQLIVVGKKIIKQIQNRHQSETEHRQKALASLQAWNDQQRLIQKTQARMNATQDPVITDCNYTGDSLRCLSH